MKAVFRKVAGSHLQNELLFKAFNLNFVTSQELIQILREMCPNTELFLVRIQENTDQKYLDTFHAMKLSSKCFWLRNSRQI